MSVPGIPSRPSKKLLPTNSTLNATLLSLTAAKIPTETAKIHNATQSRDNSMVKAVLAPMLAVWKVSKTYQDSNEEATSTLDMIIVSTTWQFKDALSTATQSSSSVEHISAWKQQAQIEAQHSINYRWCAYSLFHHLFC